MEAKAAKVHVGNLINDTSDTRRLSDFRQSDKSDDVAEVIVIAS